VDLGRGSIELDSTTEIIQGTFNPEKNASVTAVSITASELDADGAGSRETPSQNTLRIKRSPLASASSMPGARSLAVAGGGWGNVGRKLGGDV
jgi:hypothetical protein